MPTAKLYTETYLELGKLSPVGIFIGTMLAVVVFTLILLLINGR